MERNIEVSSKENIEIPSKENVEIPSKENIVRNKFPIEYDNSSGNEEEEDWITVPNETNEDDLHWITSFTFENE